MSDGPSPKPPVERAPVIPFLENFSAIAAPDGQSIMVMLRAGGQAFSMSVRFPDVRSLLAGIQASFADAMDIRTGKVRTPGDKPGVGRPLRVKPRPMRNLKYRLDENGAPILTIDVELGRRLNLALAKEDAPALAEWLSQIASKAG